MKSSAVLAPLPPDAAVPVDDDEFTLDMRVIESTTPLVVMMCDTSGRVRLDVQHTRATPARTTRSRQRARAAGTIPGGRRPACISALEAPMTARYRSAAWSCCARPRIRAISASPGPGPQRPGRGAERGRGVAGEGVGARRGARCDHGGQSGSLRPHQPAPGPAWSRTRDMRRAILSAASYVRRWQRRVTPFGLFAGVMPAGTGPASGSIAAAYQVVARADADWVAALTHALDRDAELRPRLTVIASKPGDRPGRQARRVMPCSTRLRRAGADPRGVRAVDPARAGCHRNGQHAGPGRRACGGAGGAVPRVTPGRIRRLLDG